MNRLVSRSLMVALVLFLSSAGLASAAGISPTSSPTTVSTWALLVEAWNALSGIWRGEGNPAAPNAPAPTTDSDAGSHLDPFG